MVAAQSPSPCVTQRGPPGSLLPPAAGRGEGGSLGPADPRVQGVGDRTCRSPVAAIPLCLPPVPSPQRLRPSPSAGRPHRDAPWASTRAVHQAPFPDFSRELGSAPRRDAAAPQGPHRPRREPAPAPRARGVAIPRRGLPRARGRAPRLLPLPGDRIPSERCRGARLGGHTLPAIPACCAGRADITGRPRAGRSRCLRTPPGPWTPTPAPGLRRRLQLRPRSPRAQPRRWPGRGREPGARPGDAGPRRRADGRTSPAQRRPPERRAAHTDLDRRRAARRRAARRRVTRAGGAQGARSPAAPEAGRAEGRGRGRASSGPGARSTWPGLGRLAGAGRTRNRRALELERGSAAVRGRQDPGSPEAVQPRARGDPAWKSTSAIGAVDGTPRPGGLSGSWDYGGETLER